jgi:hypothetical protein
LIKITYYGFRKSNISRGSGYAASDREFRNMLQANFADRTGDNGRLIYAEMIKNIARMAADLG